MEPSASLRQKIRKSNVRIVVTYFVVGVYSITAVGITLFLLVFRPEQTELAIGVFNGLATLAAGIAGFWFGSRGTGYPEVTPGSRSGEFDDDGNLIGPETGLSHRPAHLKSSGDDDDLADSPRIDAE